jgi:hypothetical protein
MPTNSSYVEQKKLNATVPVFGNSAGSNFVVTLKKAAVIVRVVAGAGSGVVGPGV